MSLTTPKNLAELQAKTFGHLATKARPIAMNFDSAIGRKWLALKAENTPIGVPLGPEFAFDDGTAGQAFSSGVVLHWLGGDNVVQV